MTSVGQRKSSASIPGVTNSESSARFRGGKLRKTELSVQGDNTWKDLVQHEKLMIKLWNWKWDFLHHTQPNFRREDIELKLGAEGRRLGLIPFQILEKRDYHIKASPSFPDKTSGLTGWRSGVKENSLDLYPTNYRIPKLCFVDEQYGRYRKLKYLNDTKMKKRDVSRAEADHVILPSKTIKHMVNPLLC